jgi:signal transduction histidine kinase
VERCPVPVTIAVAVDQIPKRVEAVLYFVCSEALANVVKYASASKMAISVSTDNGQVRVDIEDDGIGGADLSRGTGLRGLADRVETLGGILRVGNGAEGGTHVSAAIPLANDQE